MLQFMPCDNNNSKKAKMRVHSLNAKLELSGILFCLSFRDAFKIYHLQYQI